MGFPSPATDYIEQRVTPASVCMTPDSRILETSAGYAIIVPVTRPQQGDAIISMSSVIKVHLSAEDQFLYPYLEKVNDQKLKTMSVNFQREMADIVAEYEKFSRRWNTANKLINCDEAFRRDANVVLRKVHERMQREDHNFYPLVEQL